jgi:hypothetical protein
MADFRALCAELVELDQARESPTAVLLRALRQQVREVE